MSRKIHKPFSNFKLFILTKHNVEAYRGQLSSYGNTTEYVSSIASRFETHAIPFILDSSINDATTQAFKLPDQFIRGGLDITRTQMTIDMEMTSNNK